MPRVALCGNTMHFQQLGAGPDIVLIHGLFCSIAFWWFRVAPALAETHRVTALDLRGHGFSGMSHDRYRAVDLAQDVVSLLDHAGIERAHVIGHSFGGAVGVAMAARHPARTGRLTLADAWLPSLQEAPALSGPGGWPRLRDRLARHGLPAEREMPRVAQGFFEELLELRGTDVGGAAAVLPFGGMGRGRALRRWRQLMEQTTAQRDFRDHAGLEPETLRGLRVPVRLIYGGRSRFLPTRDRLSALLPAHESLTLPGAGHFFPLLRPHAFLRALAAEA